MIATCSAQSGVSRAPASTPPSITVTPTANRAVSSGSPAAIAPPKVASSTSAATASPISSVGDSVSSSWPTSAPLMATVCDDVVRSPASARNDAPVSAGTLSDGRSSGTLTTAVRPSGLTSASFVVTWPVSPSRCWAFASRPSIGPVTAGSVTGRSAA